MNDTKQFEDSSEPKDLSELEVANQRIATLKNELWQMKYAYLQSQSAYIQSQLHVLTLEKPQAS